MGFFDIFKKKNKIDADIRNSTDDYFQKQEKFKNLKKGELTSLPDSDLRAAVMSWMWGKFDKDWTNQYEIIKALPKPCQDVYACCTVVDEINNGGLNQLFFNSTGQFAVMAQEGFRALGNDNLCSIIRNAIEIYEKNKEMLEKYNDGTLESFSESYNENVFNKLDDEFSDEEPGFDSLLEVYIRKSESVYGD